MDLPLDSDAVAVEAGRRLFAGSCAFVAGVATLDRLPPIGLPEVAFAGRSNVGKSSLVNALTGRNTLARISNTPGRTRQLNFFSLQDRLMLVDLPGYGYAEASKAEIARWTQVVETYLGGRPNLMRVCLLVDARHGLKPNDRALMRSMDARAVAYQLVLTKLDKLPATARDRRLADTGGELAQHTAAHPEIIATSSLAGTGIAALRAALGAFALPSP